MVNQKEHLPFPMFTTTCRILFLTLKLSLLDHHESIVHSFFSNFRVYKCYGLLSAV